MTPSTRGASLPSISQAEMSLLLPVYYRHLFSLGLEDTPERLEIASVMWVAGGASALRRSASIGNAIPTMSQFVDLLRESENGSAYWSSTPEDVADELGVHDA
jgi:hypothetical protein